MEVWDWGSEPVEWLTESIGRQQVHTEALTVARITLREGATVPTHEHPSEQVANLVSGRLRFVVAGVEREVAAGESVIVPPNTPHGVEALEDSVVFDVFSPPRHDWQQGDDAYLRGDG
jgi:quercetin dioxygenase-like cupin family protein